MKWALIQCGTVRYFIQLQPRPIRTSVIMWMSSMDSIVSPVPFFIKGKSFTSLKIIHVRLIIIIIIITNHSWLCLFCSEKNSRYTSNGRLPSQPSSTSKKPRRRVASVSQRRAANIRERRRMFNLNEAFDKLRKKVIVFSWKRKWNKIWKVNFKCWNWWKIVKFIY